MTRQKSTKDALTPAQARFVAAFASLPTVAAASKAAKIGERTGQRWAKEPHIMAALRLQADDILAEAARLARAELAASVNTIVELRDSTDTPPHVRLAAAARLLDDALRLTTETDHAARLAEVERRLNERDASQTPGPGSRLAIVG